MRSRRVLLLDCGASRAVLASCSLGPGGRAQVDRMAVAPIAGGRGATGEWLDVTRAAVAELAARTRWRGDVTLLLPGHLVLYKHCRVPRVAPEALEKLVQFEAQRLLPLPLEEVVWSFGEVGESGGQLELLVAAARLEPVEALCAAVESAGWRVRAVLPPAMPLLALARRMQAQDPGAADAVLWVEVGARTTTLLFVGPQRALARSVAFGGRHVTESLAAHFGGDLAAAEAAKIAGEPSAALRTAVDAAATRLAQEITRTALHFGRQHQVAAPVSVRLVGGGAAIPEFATRLSEKLSLPVAPVELGADFSVAPTAAEATARLGASALASVAGAVWFAHHAASGRLDLRPPRLRARASQRRRMTWLLAAAVVSASALGWPMWAASNYAAELRAQIARVEAEIAPLRARDVANRRLGEELAAVQQRVAVWQRVGERRGAWLSLLADLDLRVSRVEDVWFDGLRTLPGESGAPLRLALSGRLVQHVSAPAGDQALSARVAALLEGLADSPYVATVEEPRFDASQPAVLRFECVLVVKSARPL